MCQTLTSISTYYLTISAYLLFERFLRNVYDIISDNFKLGQVKTSGGQVVMCHFFIPLSSIGCLLTRVFLNRIASFEKLKNNNNKYQNTISPYDG